MPSCAVATCTNTHLTKEKELIFHRFPRKNQLVSQKWVSACKRNDDFKAVNAAVCSDHFTKDDYNRDLQHELLNLPIRFKRNLKKDAVPSVSLPQEKIKISADCLYKIKRKPKIVLKGAKESKKCLFCYSTLEDYRLSYPTGNKKGQTTAAKNPADTDVDCDTVTMQLDAIYVLRKLLDIPVDKCSQFLKDYGHPHSWISYCDTCSIFVNKSKKLFHQIKSLQKDFESMQTEFGHTIVKSVNSEEKCENVNNNAEDIVRSYVADVWKDTYIMPVEVKMEVEENMALDMEVIVKAECESSHPYEDEEAIEWGNFTYKEDSVSVETFDSLCDTFNEIDEYLQESYEIDKSENLHALGSKVRNAQSDRIPNDISISNGVFSQSIDKKKKPKSRRKEPLKCRAVCDSAPDIQIFQITEQDKTQNQEPYPCSYSEEGSSLSAEFQTDRNEEEGNFKGNTQNFVLRVVEEKFCTVFKNIIHQLPPNNVQKCQLCGVTCEDKKSFEDHVTIHSLYLAQ